MKPFTLNVRQIIILLSLTIILLGLIASVFLSLQRQEIRKKAAGTGAIQVILESTSGTTLAPGQSSVVNIMIRNDTTSSKSLRAAGADLQFDTNILAVSAVSCGQALTQEAVKKVEGNKISLSCFIQGGETYNLAGGAQVKLGSFNIQVNSSASSGQSAISFVRTNIPDAITYADLSDQGTAKSFTISSIPTPTPTTSVPSVTPIPPSGDDEYKIDIGEKEQLSVNIGAGEGIQIRFKAKLASLQSYPDMYLKLRVKDELAFLDRQNSSTTSTDTCNNPIPPDKDFFIPVKASGDVYSPVQQISQPAPTGAVVASVTPDGWVILDGAVQGKYYSLFLKGPKTRKSRMMEHFLLQPEKGVKQDFDWSGKPLDPGDLPDPNNGGKQDCTINSVDWSLQKARIGSNDGGNLAVCDVNYDGICNAGDSVAILDTLSKRPDDDF